jgi:hypothetical protein
MLREIRLGLIKILNTGRSASRIFLPHSSQIYLIWLRIYFANCVANNFSHTICIALNI